MLVLFRQVEIRGHIAKKKGRVQHCWRPAVACFVGFGAQASALRIHRVVVNRCIRGLTDSLVCRDYCGWKKCLKSTSSGGGGSWFFASFSRALFWCILLPSVSLSALNMWLTSTSSGGGGNWFFLLLFDMVEPR